MEKNIENVDQVEGTSRKGRPEQIQYPKVSDPTLGKGLSGFAPFEPVCAGYLASDTKSWKGP